MHPNAQLIHTFYQAFQKLDGDAMAACYHPDIEFSDPAFPDLHGKRAGDMWRMLCSRAADLKLEYSDVQADDEKGSAHWKASYTFSATGRQVHNVIDAEFTFQDGKIRTHRDRFDFYRWTRMALGFKGLLLGWSPVVQNAVRKQASKGLDIFIQKQKQK